MSASMEDRVKPEYAELQRAMLALGNAFAFFDDPAEWADDPEEHAEVWWGACNAAGNVEMAAENLAEAARKIARQLDEALPI